MVVGGDNLADNQESSMEIYNRLIMMMMMRMSLEIYSRLILIIIGDYLMTTMLDLIFVLQEEIHIDCDCDDDNKNNADDIHIFFAL